MKKQLLLLILAWGITANLCFGQGEFYVENPIFINAIYTNGVVDGQSTGQVGAEMPANTVEQYTFAIFINTALNPTSDVPSPLTPSATPWADDSWIFTGNYLINWSHPGRLTDTNGNVNLTVTVLLTGANAGLGAVGNNANIEMIGWNDAVGGTSLSSFINAYNANAAGLYYGYSYVGNITLGNTSTEISGLFDNPNDGAITGFTLAPIPEPGVSSLVALGGISLVLSRRLRCGSFNIYSRG